MEGDDSDVESANPALYFPRSMRNPRIRVFHSQNVIPGLPAKVEPLGGKEEREIVFSLVSDLNTNFGIKVDPNL